MYAIEQHLNRCNLLNCNGNFVNESKLGVISRCKEV